MAQVIDGKVVYAGGESVPTVGSPDYVTAAGGSLPAVTPPNSVTNISSAPQVKLPNVTPSSGNIGPATASVDGRQKMIDLLIQQQKDIQTQKDNQANSADATESKSFLDKLVGGQSPSDARAAATSETGINPTQYFAKEQASITEINNLSDQYSKMLDAKNNALNNADQNSTGAFGGGVDVIKANIERNYAPGLNNLSTAINTKTALLHAEQGNFQEAQTFIKQAVDDATSNTKYNLDLYTTFYNENKDALNNLDTKYQDAFKTALDLADKQYTQDKADKSTLGQLIINNPQAGITMDDTLNSAYAKIGANPKAEKPTIIGTAATGYTQQVYDPKTNTYKLVPINNGTGGSGSYKFTNTQLNKGSETAGLGLSDFKGLDQEVQNYYISTPASFITKLKTDLGSVKDGSLDPTQMSSDIDSENIPDAVKTYLKGLITKATPAPTTSGFEWYNPSTWFR